MDRATAPAGWIWIKARENWVKIQKSDCPRCGARGEPLCERCHEPSNRWRMYSVPPHFARREAAIRDGHYQP